MFTQSDSGDEGHGSNRYSLPSALDPGTDLARQLEIKKPAMFLDYDGTLVNIGISRGMSTLDDHVRTTLTTLTKYCPVAIVTGRERADVENEVGIESIVYAGSHGFDIRGPGIEEEYGKEFLQDLNGAKNHLLQSLSSFPGTFLESKKYSLSVYVGGAGT